MVEYVEFQGKTRWFKPTTPNKYGRWSHEIVFNPESLEKFRDLQLSTKSKNKDGKEITIAGIMNRLKKDEDGYFSTFTRPLSKEIGGKLRGYEAPKVYQADGNTPLTQFVGNGSDVTTTCELYTYPVPGTKDQRGRALRWFSTRVDNLVPYETNKDADSADRYAADRYNRIPAERYVSPF